MTLTIKKVSLILLALDAVFFALGCLMVLSRRFLGVLFGILLIVLSGRAFWQRLKSLWNSGKKDGRAPETPREQTRREDGPIVVDEDGDRIQVTDLSGAKEVEFEKE